jgi:hypothetical protein
MYNVNKVREQRGWKVKLAAWLLPWVAMVTVLPFNRGVSLILDRILVFSEGTTDEGKDSRSFQR